MSIRKKIVVEINEKKEKKRGGGVGWGEERK